MTRQPIRVRKVHRQHDNHQGYRWTCDLCPRSSGFHAYDRWIDRRLAERGKQDRHPWIRCMEGANLHYHRYHALRGPQVNIEIHQLTINT